MRFATSLLFAGTILGQAPTERALAFLSAEVPAWEKKNGCFSCHNNGDGSRALYAARRLDAARSSTEWLSKPELWDKGKSDTPGSDKTLALYQFSTAIVDAVDAGAIRDPALLRFVAEKLASIQQADGSWRVEDEGEAPGSPVTWGTTLATHNGRRTLLAAGGYGPAVARAEKWLRETQPRHIHDEAAVLLTFPQDPTVRKRAIERFRQSQTSDGGWGPRRHAPAEVFDTAMVLLALRAAGEWQLIPGGRQFLIRSQLSSGGWPETTRPSGSQSYAQHISTSAWATMALLATDPDSKRK